MQVRCSFLGLSSLLYHVFFGTWKDITKQCNILQHSIVRLYIVTKVLSKTAVTHIVILQTYKGLAQHQQSVLGNSRIACDPPQ